jgi:hypothetical protein
MGYSIWTFDLVKREVPKGSVLRAVAPDFVFYEECGPDFTLAQATERALTLAMRHGGVYIVRTLLPSGTWSAPTSQQWREGVTHVEMRLREDEAKAKRKRQLKKMGVYYE